MTGLRVRAGRRWLLPVICGVMLGGCPQVIFRGGEPGRDPLTQRRWVLRQLQGQPVSRHDPEAATFTFVVDHTVSGTVNCNAISSHAHTWYVDQPKRRGHFGHDRSKPSISTAAGCHPNPVAVHGARFWDLMDTAQQWSTSGKTLRIRFADGSVALLVDAGKIPKR